MSLDEILDVSAYSHDTTVLVELTGRDATGELVVASYEFAVDDDATLTPRGPIDDAHEAPIHDALTTNGYTVSAE